jgi:NMD protein affecting ribosome stability and mRNA decay
VIGTFPIESRDTYEIIIPPIREIPSKIDVKLSSSKDSNDITILLKQALCKTCNKLLSRRFDAVIQLRTIKMKSNKSKDLLDSLIDEVVEHAQKIQLKNPEQFISDIEELPQGFDLKLSIKSMMTSIQSYLTSRYAFIVKTSKKLMGKNPNTGGDLYRTYVLLRYIPFQVNNVIRIQNKAYSVKKIQANRIILEDMDSHVLKTHNFDYFEKKLIERLDV